ncbi:UNVERIFIED_CONTAM: hypothetical protein HDU68_009896 [Siphonaria sp. JEL0065]|nr:hypothetical protein HDU68_009896 [Siphonaria sp. JEL0065]
MPSQLQRVDETNKPRIGSATIRRKNNNKYFSTENSDDAASDVEVVEFVVSLAKDYVHLNGDNGNNSAEAAVCAWGEGSDSDDLLLQKLMAENSYPIPMPYVKLGKSESPNIDGDLDVYQRQSQPSRLRRTKKDRKEGPELSASSDEDGGGDEGEIHFRLPVQEEDVQEPLNISSIRVRLKKEAVEEKEDSSLQDDRWSSFWDPNPNEIPAVSRNQYKKQQSAAQYIPKLTPRERRLSMLALEKSLRPASGSPASPYVEHTPPTFAKTYGGVATSGLLSNRDFETHNNLLHQSLMNSDMIVTKKYNSKEEYGGLRSTTASERAKEARLNGASTLTSADKHSLLKPQHAFASDASEVDHWTYLKQRRSVTPMLSSTTQRPPSSSIRSSIAPHYPPRDYPLDPPKLYRRPSSSFPLISTSSSTSQLMPEPNIPRYDSFNSTRGTYTDYLFGRRPSVVEDEPLNISRLTLSSASRPANIPRRSKTTLGQYERFPNE